MKIFNEIGIGNDNCCSAEIEFENGSEIRLPFLIKIKISEFYIRIWILKKVLILSSKEGIKIKIKNTDRLKIIFGWC